MLGSIDAHDLRSKLPTMKRELGFLGQPAFFDNLDIWITLGVFRNVGQK